MDRKKSVFLGLFFIVACGLCVFYGYEKYKDYNEAGMAINKTFNKIGVKKKMVDDSDIPVETKYAGFGAALTGLAAAYFLLTGKSG